VQNSEMLARIATHLDHIEQSLGALVKIGEVLLDCIVPVRQQTAHPGIVVESVALRVASVGVLSKVQSGEGEGGAG
jgi:hypothetical protein